MNINDMARKAFAYARQRQVKEGIESPSDIVAMCRHASSELFEVIDAYKGWQAKACNPNVFFDKDVNSAKSVFAGEIADVIMCCLIVASAQGVDIEAALEKCLEKNRKRAEADE